jgi:hypothetical protein
MPMSDDPNHRGASRRWIMTEVENSLRRLGTDHLDLYQMHRYDPDVDLDETLGTLTDLVRAGKVRYIGHSTFPASALVDAQCIARDRERFVTEQPSYSIRTRNIENEIPPLTQRYGMGVRQRWKRRPGLAGVRGAVRRHPVLGVIVDGVDKGRRPPDVRLDQFWLGRWTVPPARTTTARAPETMRRRCAACQVAG